MITINGIHNKLVKISQEHKITSEGGAFENRLKSIEAAFCTGIIQEIRLEDIHLKRLDLKIKTEEKIQFKLEEECVTIYFLFEGRSGVRLIPNEQFSLNIGTHNLFYTPPCSIEIQVQPCHCDLVCLKLPVETFKEYTRHNKGVFVPFFAGIKEKKAVFLRREPGIIGHRIHRIIDEICDNTHQKEVRALFIKAKIIELLSVQMEQLCNLCSPPSSLSKESAQKMFSVRDFILEHVGEYHSLKSLAKRVGTNEYTLKKEFKELFGNTVFGYWHEIKMDKAQALLLENEISIKQIAEIIGYKNPQHFSTAFKKKFGQTPTIFRKEKGVGS